MRLYRAISEYIEARAELLREEASSLHLGKWAAGYKAGQEDLMEGAEVVYIGADEDEDEPDCG
jgi:hypothetical protein